MMTIRLGASFATPIIVLGGILATAGLFSAIGNPVFGVLLILIGLFLLTSAYGVQIDHERNRFREYTSNFGLKAGEWIPLDELPYLSVLYSRTTSSQMSMSNRSTSSTQETFDVCLLNQTHRKRYVVQRFNQKERADAFATQLAEELGKTVQKYSPEISAQTLRRRRR